ncbi:MAG: tetratricopeptide repeat protein [Candidatus Kapabacteria bacterium]|jgi:tetratricopeptide (TPR) repeat protein|nr:tetratricopeptide repeat protein [Candidatus Kapabacteria bacterium]
MRLIIYITVLFISFGSSVAFSPKDEFKMANDLFNNGNYSDAAEKYHTLLDSGYLESEIYYNLGNSYFRMDDIKSAILYFERAKKLNPGDEDINFNLKLANLRIVDKFEPVPKLFFIEWYEYAIMIMYSGVWGTVLVISVWTLFLSLTFLLFSRLAGIRKLFVIVLFLSFFTIVFSGLLGYKAFDYETSKNEAVIFNESVYVKSAPDPGSTDLFILHEGTKVLLMESIDNWLQIRIDNGDIGWIKNDEVEVI